MGLQPAPGWLFEPDVRHLVVLAHQDDELPYAGLISRMNSGPDSLRVVFVTNGDGLADESTMAPEPYAALREDESRRALDLLGVSEAQITWLRHSELSLYAEFGAMSDDTAGSRPFFAEFDQIAAEIADLTQEIRPDVVWTLAWQGGNPEHDLTHAAALRAFRFSAPAARAFYELPAYELRVVAMRFRPWIGRVRHRISLSDAELATKTAMMEMYPTQQRIISELKGVTTVAGKLARLIGRGFTLEDFARVEEFAPVPEGRDYSRSTHLSERFDYPGDDWQGRPIVFGRTLGRIGQRWLG